MIVNKVCWYCGNNLIDPKVNGDPYTCINHSNIEVDFLFFNNSDVIRIYLKREITNESIITFGAKTSAWHGTNNTIKSHITLPNYFLYNFNPEQAFDKLQILKIFR